MLKRRFGLMVALLIIIPSIAIIIKEALRNKLEEFKKGVKNDDDVTFLILKKQI